MRSDMATLQIQASKESQNSTNGNWKSSTNLSISELEQIKDRIDTLESVADIHASALSHLETGASVLEHRIEKATENLTSQDVTITALNDSIMQLKVLTNDLSNSSETGGKTLSQLEADMNSFEAMRQELYSSVIEFEANITADRAFKLRLMTVIANMEANLTSATQMIKTQGDTIQAINETVVQMGTVTSRANSSSLIDTDILLADLEAELESRLLQIELDVAKEKSKNLSSNLTDLELEIGILKIKNQDHHDILSKNSDRIGLLNENIMAYFDIAHNLSSNVTTLEMQIGTINEAIQNKHGEIIDNSGRIRLLNETVTAILGNAQNFESNIADLERDIGTVKIAIQNNNNEIASSFADIEDLNKSTSDSLSQLATRLTEETGNQFIL